MDHRRFKMESEFPMKHHQSWFTGPIALFVVAVLVALCALIIQANAAANPDSASNHPGARPGSVSALGRLEPEHGLIRVAAPSLPGITAGVVIRELMVDEGDDVVEGQLMAVSDLVDLLKAAVQESEANLELARRQAETATSQADSTCVLADVREREAARRESWRETNIASAEEAEKARGDATSTKAACTAARTATVAEQAKIILAEARLRRALADLGQAHIRAPMPGRVLKVLSRPGELVTLRGAFELGRVDRMFAVAEVYETDIRRVAVGQAATVTSAALERPLTGVVERIRRKVEKQDELGTDPAARKDARIVEVEILLDDPEPAAALTNLQVTVVIDTR